MTHPTNYKFHSTSQFRNVVKSIKEQATFTGIDEDGNAKFDKTRTVPTLTYLGTTKLHGTNGSIVLHEDGVISFHSKNNLLGYVKGGEFTLLSDNSEFAQSMSRRMDSVNTVVNQAITLVKNYYGSDLRPIKISGEWCGSGIQKGVGISYLPKRSFFIFGVKAGDTCQESKQGWLPAYTTESLTTNDTHFEGIYSIMDFPTKRLDIDFNNPEFSQNELVKATEEVENCCPVSKQLNLKDADGNNALLGEGYVWTPIDENYCWDSGSWFKTKGKKHSVSKVKSIAAICPEKLASIQEFVEYAVTTNRLQQGLQEVGLDQKKVGQYIGWVNKDINKEEADVLESNNLTMKEVGKYLSNKAREFYLQELNNLS